MVCCGLLALCQDVQIGKVRIHGEQYDRYDAYSTSSFVFKYQVVGGQTNVAEIGEGGGNHVKDLVSGRDVQGRNKDGDQVQGDDQAHHQQCLGADEVGADNP